MISWKFRFLFLLGPPRGPKRKIPFSDNFQKWSKPLIFTTLWHFFGTRNFWFGLPWVVAEKIANSMFFLNFGMIFGRWDRFSRFSILDRPLKEKGFQAQNDPLGFKMYRKSIKNFKFAIFPGPWRRTWKSTKKTEILQKGCKNHEFLALLKIYRKRDFPVGGPGGRKILRKFEFSK